MLEVPLYLEPMEAEAVAKLPRASPDWQYEPKVDGFRCIIFRDGDQVHLQSRNQKPLGRYFPEIERAARLLPWQVFVLDGEIIIPGQPFDVLQARLRRVSWPSEKFPKAMPAQFVAFDLLADTFGKSMLHQSFRVRRSALEKFFEPMALNQTMLLSRATSSPNEAHEWLNDLGKGLDGIVAKRLDIPYSPGKRAMQKYKVWKTVDCVVGGVYRYQERPAVEYLLLGLYDDAVRLNYVGRCGVHGLTETHLAKRLVPLFNKDGGFDGKQPADVSQWSRRQRNLIPLLPHLVVEVSADHVENGLFRHGSRFIRWRPDKDPKDCKMDQVL